MAIVALGRFSKSQLENFAMMSFKITFSYFMVTLAAGINDGFLETLGISTGNFMRIMTVIAHGQIALFIGFTSEVDALTENHINTLVTFGTGIGNIGSAHTGINIFAGQDRVGSVATDTSGCNHQSTFIQGAAMDAILIVGHHALHVTLITSVSNTPVIMAFATKIGNIAYMSNGHRIIMRQNRVAGPTNSMTGHTGW